MMVSSWDIISSWHIIKPGDELEEVTLALVLMLLGHILWILELRESTAGTKPRKVK